MEDDMSDYRVKMEFYRWPDGTISGRPYPKYRRLWDSFCERAEGWFLFYLALPWMGLIVVIAAFNWLRTGSWEI